jgi:hypothetical protein
MSSVISFLLKLVLKISAKKAVAKREIAPIDKLALIFLNKCEPLKT